MRWRQVDSGEVPVFTRGKTIARGALTEDASPRHVVYTLFFKEGSAYRSKHTSTPDGILNQYEVGEP
jgi:hypothetical protein